MSYIFKQVIPLTEESLTELRTNPGIPYKQQLIEIPKNFLPNTEYCIGQTSLDTSEGLNNNILIIKTMINNITEILSYSVLNQNIKIIESLEESFNEIKKKLLLIESNQEEIKTDLNQIKNDIQKENSSKKDKTSSSIIQSIILAKSKDSSESRFTKPLF